MLALTPPGAADRATPLAAPVTVTLITGDRVTLTGRGGVKVEPGAGRAGITFVVGKQGGRVRVLPSDAAAPLRQGRLDPRLVDVTALLAFGYDDRRESLPLIVTGSKQARAAQLRTSLSAAGARPGRELSAVSGLAVGVAWQERARF